MLRRMALPALGALPSWPIYHVHIINPSYPTINRIYLQIAITRMMSQPSDVMADGREQQQKPHKLWTQQRQPSVAINRNVKNAFVKYVAYKIKE